MSSCVGFVKFPSQQTCFLMHHKEYIATLSGLCNPSHRLIIFWLMGQAIHGLVCVKSSALQSPQQEGSTDCHHLFVQRFQSLCSSSITQEVIKLYVNFVMVLQGESWKMNSYVLLDTESLPLLLHHICPSACTKWMKLSWTSSWLLLTIVFPQPMNCPTTQINEQFQNEGRGSILIWRDILELGGWVNLWNSLLWQEWGDATMGYTQNKHWWAFEQISRNGR